jgi:hypothetical protein
MSKTVEFGKKTQGILGVNHLHRLNCLTDFENH